MGELLVGPFNRVEGDLEVRLDVAGAEVREAWVNAPLYRGFEQILLGRWPSDSLALAPRICGICSVSQSSAAARALALATGVAVPDNGRISANLLLATENVADHVTHFYLFFMPDFARDVYAGEPWHEAVAQRFRAVRGEAAAQVLPARARLLHVLGILAGKWPHTLSLQPGGTTRAVQRPEIVRLRGILREFRAFLERHTFADDLEHIVAIDSLEALRAWARAEPWQRGDLRTVLHLSESLSLHGLGQAEDRFMSYGSFPDGHGRLFRSGVWDSGEPRSLDTDTITEDVSHAWMDHPQGAPLHPSRGVTVPDHERPDGYSWCKAPRLAGRVVEVGALARQVVDGHPLARALVAHSGGNVRNRVIARLLETARLVLAMDDWLGRLRPGEPFCAEAPLPGECEAVGLVEAARGSLGHWLSVRDGRIAGYQIVAPTTWNFSPRDADGRPGALEQALVGAPVRPGEREPVAVQHVVRSFDPCMVCTVH